MACVHGFTNKIAALKFEWAWQNPKRSRHLAQLVSALQFPKGIEGVFMTLHLMLRSDPWCKHPLNVLLLNERAKEVFNKCQLPGAIRSRWRGKTAKDKKACDNSEEKARGPGRGPKRTTYTLPPLPPHISVQVGSFSLLRYIEDGAPDDDDDSDVEEVAKLGFTSGDEGQDDNESLESPSNDYGWGTRLLGASEWKSPYEDDYDFGVHGTYDENFYEMTQGYDTEDELKTPSGSRSASPLTMGVAIEETTRKDEDSGPTATFDEIFLTDNVLDVRDTSGNTVVEDDETYFSHSQRQQQPELSIGMTQTMPANSQDGESGYESEGLYDSPSVSDNEIELSQVPNNEVCSVCKESLLGCSLLFIDKPEKNNARPLPGANKPTVYCPECRVQFHTLCLARTMMQSPVPLAPPSHPTDQSSTLLSIRSEVDTNECKLDATSAASSSSSSSSASSSSSSSSTTEASFTRTCKLKLIPDNANCPSCVKEISWPSVLNYTRSRAVRVHHKIQRREKREQQLAKQLERQRRRELKKETRSRAPVAGTSSNSHTMEEDDHKDESATTAAATSSRQLSKAPSRSVTPSVLLSGSSAVGTLPGIRLGGGVDLGRIELSRPPSRGKATADSTGILSVALDAEDDDLQALSPQGTSIQRIRNREGGTSARTKHVKLDHEPTGDAASGVNSSLSLGAAMQADEASQSALPGDSIHHQSEERVEQITLDGFSFCDFTPSQVLRLAQTLEGAL